MQELIQPLVRIEDAKIERMLRRSCISAPRMSGISAGGKGGGAGRHEEGWTQLALHSACLAVQDVCLVPARERTESMVEAACLRRFTNRHYRFHSGEHFLQTRYEVVRHLQTFFVHQPCEGTVMARFEPFTVYVEELDMELAQHFHLICSQEAGAGDGYVVQKLVADDNEEALELYRHMTTVFGMSAFGRLPSRIEALLPLSGRRIVWQPQLHTWRRSLDYLRLVKSMLLDGAGAPSAAVGAMPAM